MDGSPHGRLDEVQGYPLVEEPALAKSASYGNGFHFQLSQRHIVNPREGIAAVPKIQDLKSAKNLNDKSCTTSEYRQPVETMKQDRSVAYRNLNVYGFGTATDYQKTFANFPLAYLSHLRGLFGHVRKSRIDILRNFEGLVSGGEMLLVLGRPGSGCTTFLKTIAGYTHGLYVDKSSEINYHGKNTDGENFFSFSVV